jgi:hypothetical protein
LRISGARKLRKRLPADCVLSPFTLVVDI